MADLTFYAIVIICVLNVNSVLISSSEAHLNVIDQGDGMDTNMQYITIIMRPFHETSLILFASFCFSCTAMMVYNEVHNINIIIIIHICFHHDLFIAAPRFVLSETRIHRHAQNDCRNDVIVSCRFKSLTFITFIIYIQMLHYSAQ